MWTIQRTSRHGPNDGEPCSAGRAIGSDVGLPVGFSLALAAGRGGGAKAPSVANLGTTSRRRRRPRRAPRLRRSRRPRSITTTPRCINAHGAQARAIPGGGVGLDPDPGDAGTAPSSAKGLPQATPEGRAPCADPGPERSVPRPGAETRPVHARKTGSRIPRPQRQRQPLDHPEQRHRPPVASVPGRPESVRPVLPGRRPTVTSVTARCRPGGPPRRSRQ